MTIYFSEKEEALGKYQINSEAAQDADVIIIDGKTYKDNISLKGGEEKSGKFKLLICNEFNGAKRRYCTFLENVGEL